MKNGLWNIVNGTETAPSVSDTDRRAKFVTRRDRALATIVLSVKPSLLYLIGDPEDPITVWQKLANQFEKKQQTAQTARLAIEGWYKSTLKS